MYHVEKSISKMLMNLTQENQKIIAEPEYKDVAKRLPCVKLDDVKEISIELKYRFKLKKLEPSQIESLLITEAIRKKNAVSIFEIKAILMKEPFIIQNNEQVLLLSRYLIEENNYSFVNFNVNLTQEINKVKTIFRHLIGKYEILSLNEEKDLKKDIANFLQKFQYDLEVAFKQLYPMKKYTSYISIEMISALFDNVFKNTLENPNLEDIFLDYILMKLFEVNNSIHQLSFQDIFIIFKIDQNKYRKS